MDSFIYKQREEDIDFPETTKHIISSRDFGAVRKKSGPMKDKMNKQIIGIGIFAAVALFLCLGVVFLWDTENRNRL